MGSKINIQVVITGEGVKYIKKLKLLWKPGKN